MPDDLTPGAGPFTPGIAPNPPSPLGGYHGVLPLWLHNAIQFIVDPFGTRSTPGGGVPGAMAPTAAPANETAAQAVTPSPGTQEAIKSGTIAQDFSGLPNKIGGAIADRLGLPKGGIDWTSVGVYLALFLLFVVGVTSLLSAAKER